MDARLNLVFLWHMHQPDYRDAFSGQPLLPWVRLHGTRGYLDMAAMLWRFPEVKATVNFVPVLIDQLEAVVTGGERDLYWHLTLKPAAELTEADARFVLAHFFSVNHESCIRPRQRYWSLLQKRGTDLPFRAPGEFTEQELRDIQVLFNLTWFGFAARELLPELEVLEAKGRNFTEDDKRRVLELQVEALGRVLPMWRALGERGQVELTATPYFHPILPLLMDSNVAARAMPQAPLPPRFSAPDDARLQVERAVARHAEVFGQPPVGMWPAEGSVSPEVVPLFAAAGLRYIATDEAQLFRSLPAEAHVSRGILHQPWTIEVGGARIDAFFRDHEISDLIGFTYARNPASVAVDDFIGRLEAIASRAGTGPTPTVSIILDGENPWEAYPQSGQAFLETLYTRLTQHPKVRTALPSEVLDARTGPAPTLRTLHSGSWIGGDYAVWIGHAIENTAWRHLGDARAFFAKAEARGAHGPEVLERCREHLLRAEGSDWFWWYGDTFQSDNDADFDYLFRAHLRRMYTLLGAEIPAPLERSLYPTAPSVAQREPRSFVSPNFHGESTYYDWLGAGTIELSGGTSSMYRVSNAFSRLRYGFDLDSLFFRLDPPDAGERTPLAGLVLRVETVGAERFQADIDLDSPESAQVWHVGADGERFDPVPLRQVKVRHGGVELGLPFRALRAAAGDALQISLHLLRDRVELDRYPGGRSLSLVVPDESFEDANWSV
jgi:alpha-amylase/alpha-mannosidase (GH57 family)